MNLIHTPTHVTQSGRNSMQEDAVHTSFCALMSAVCAGFSLGLKFSHLWRPPDTQRPPDIHPQCEDQTHFTDPGLRMEAELQKQTCFPDCGPSPIFIPKIILIANCVLGFCPNLRGVFETCAVSFFCKDKNVTTKEEIFLYFSPKLGEVNETKKKRKLCFLSQQTQEQNTNKQQ